MDRAIASDLSYAVLQKQRREAELAAVPRYQATQSAYPSRPIVGTKAECLIERLSDEIQPLLAETRSGRAHGF